jgi:hypothetical protein
MGVETCCADYAALLLTEKVDSNFANQSRFACGLKAPEFVLRKVNISLSLKN